MAFGFELASGAEQETFSKSKPSRAVDLAAYTDAVGKMLAARGANPYSPWAKVKLNGTTRKTERVRFSKAAKLAGTHVEYHASSDDATLILRLRPAPKARPKRETNGAVTTTAAPTANGPAKVPAGVAK